MNANTLSLEKCPLKLNHNLTIDDSLNIIALFKFKMRKTVVVYENGYFANFENGKLSRG